MQVEMLKERYQRSRVVVQAGESLECCRIQFSDDAKWILVACGSHIKVYSHNSKEVVHTLHHHADKVTSIVLSPRKKMQLFSSALDGHLALWDYSDGSLLRVVDLGTPLFRFGIRPGKQEPSFFFEVSPVSQVEEVDTEHSPVDNKTIVGVSSHIVLERQSVVAPGNQLAESQEFIYLGLEPRDFVFSPDGTYLVSYNRKKLFVCDIDSEQLFRYKTVYPITSLSFHPSKPIVATGDDHGQILLWYDFAGSDAKVVTTKLHWHAHAVRDLCFTTDGTYLLSGGEESVLVLWQLDAHKEHFRPRLGSPISRVGCSPGDSYFTVSLQNNTVHLVSGLDNEIECTLGGLRKAFTQDPFESGIKTGLVLDPRSRSLVLNSTPGFLQFYHPERDSIVHELDVTRLNYISRPADKPLVLTTVEQAAFSPDGVWLATVEWRDDRKTIPELRMKFWQFDTATQNYILNTCVDPPHDQKVTSLVFQPKRPPQEAATREDSSKDPQSGTLVPQMAVSASLDGRFKTWIVVDAKREKKSTAPSWACRSVGYYHSLPCMEAAFCEDGSLLGLNFCKCVTIWDPFTCELRATFSGCFPQEKFVHLVFGHHSSSQYLMATSPHHLYVWDLLSCSVLWCVKVSVSLLVADPFSPLAAAFVPQSNTMSSHLYIFNPASPTPLAIHGSVCQEQVIGAVFVPSGRVSKEVGGAEASGHQSTLFFMNKQQLLYSLVDEEESPTSKESTDESVPVARREQPSERAFYEIFGGPTQKRSVPASAPMFSATTKSGTLVQQVFSAPPHVLPPMSALCRSFLHALLPPHAGGSTRENTAVNEEEASDTEETGRQSSDFEDETPHSPKGRQQMEAEVSRMEVDEDTQRTALVSPVESYNWLIEPLRTLS